MANILSPRSMAVGTSSGTLPAPQLVDALDSPDFDAVKFLNDMFPTGGFLGFATHIQRILQRTATNSEWFAECRISAICKHPPAIIHFGAPVGFPVETLRPRGGIVLSRTMVNAACCLLCLLCCSCLCARHGASFGAVLALHPCPSQSAPTRTLGAAACCAAHAVLRLHAGLPAGHPIRGCGEGKGGGGGSGQTMWWHEAGWLSLARKC